jgi:hypothetical protein
VGYVRAWIVSFAVHAFTVSKAGASFHGFG